MLTKVTPRIEFDHLTQEWKIPEVWKDWGYIVNPSNYPDPDFLVFKDEFDFELIDTRGILHRYKNHIMGSSKEYINAQGKSVIRNMTPKCYQYYLFAKAAVRLINDPSLYREALENKLNGTIVINYLNLCNIFDLIPPAKADVQTELYRNLDRKKHLVSAEFGACMARVFNATSGLHLHAAGKQYELKVERREDKYALCPKCGSIYTQLTRDVVEATDENYPAVKEKLIKQIEYDRHRRENG